MSLSFVRSPYIFFYTKQHPVILILIVKKVVQSFSATDSYLKQMDLMKYYEFIENMFALKAAAEACSFLHSGKIMASTIIFVILID